MAASANPSANDENTRHGAAPPPSDYGNSAAETSGQQTSVGLRHNPDISTEWSADEQSILDELVIKHASEPSIVRYAKIAVLLKDKTVRDVALRCRWMTDHKVRIIQWMIPSSGFVFMAMLLDICGMHLNKALYSLTYTCLTAGVAGILFSGIYILVDVYGFRRPLTMLEWIGKHALAIFILAAYNIVPIVLLGVYWREPQNNISTDIKALHHPDGREIDVKSLLQHVKDIILFTNEEQEEPRMVTSKEVPPLTWCKSLLVPLEKLMRDISKRDNTSAVAVSILKELLPYAWGAKAVLVLTSFAMNHGLWMLAQMYSASPPSLKKVKDNNKLYSVLSRVLSKGSELDAYYFYLSLILSFSKRPKENRLPKPALTSLLQAIVRVVECIIELQDLPSEDLQDNVTGYKITMAKIPITVYNVITMVIYCAAVINQFPNNDYEISEAEVSELSLYASQINELVNDLSKKIRVCNQVLEETKYDKEYQIPIPETSSTDNREALEYLIKSGDDPKLLNAADTIISQLKGKHVMLLVSDEDSSMDEIIILDQIYGDMKEQFSILWIPLYSGIGKERAARHFQTQIRNMNWYAVPHPSMVSKEATEFIKNKWRFQSKSNILVMLDPQGTVLNINALHMIWIWGLPGFPFTRSKERALWKTLLTININMLSILYVILPATLEWIREGKYIFLYGGDDIEWVRKFTTSVKRVSQKFNIPVELVYVGKPNKGVHQRTTKKLKEMMTNEAGLSHVFLDEMMSWFFWSRLRSMLISKMSHPNRQLASVMHVFDDRITRQLKWLLGYETERSWALLAKGMAVVTHGPGSTILQALTEYETKKVGEYGGSFEDEFEKLHKKVVSSGRPVCCQVEFPVWSSGMPETMRCPQPNCKTDMMDKSIVFECCHHKLLPEK